MNPTASQKRAIETDSPRVLCMAGPGSGKTTVIVERIKHLISTGVPPAEIACVTFTNSAAREIRERLGEDVVLGHSGTLHSFCLTLLKRHGESLGYGERTAVIGPESAKDLLESKAKSLGCKTSMKEILERKAQGRPKSIPRGDVPATVVASYYDDLKVSGVVDYDSILTETAELLLTRPAGLQGAFRCLLVDEVQDSSPTDWEIYLLFPARDLFLVGDQDQAIYSWRGGSLAHTVSFSEREDVETILLEENFRSRSEICSAANRLISRNALRIHKETKSSKGSGGLVVRHNPCVNEGEEIAVAAREIKAFLSERPDASVAVLARTNYIVSNHAKVLANCGIKVSQRQVQALPRDWPMARAFLELLCSPDNDALAFFYLVALYEKKGAPPKDARSAAHAARRAANSVGQSLNRASIGFSSVSNPRVAMEALSSCGVSRESLMIAHERYRELPPGATASDLALSLAEVREYAKEEGEGGVHCLTVHGAKGREFDAVFLVGLEDEVLPGSRPGEDVEEARRLAYVAITRARDQLHLLNASSRVTKWKEVVTHKPSRFIEEMIS